jgi:hypothetical protein
MLNSLAAMTRSPFMFRCYRTAAATGAPLYYVAKCSNSNLNPNAVTFYSDASCSTVASTAVPSVSGTSAGTMAALEYPCVTLTETTSVSAGAWNERLYGVGSLLLWTGNNKCQGLTSFPGFDVVSRRESCYAERISPNTYVQTMYYISDTQSY